MGHTVGLVFLIDSDDEAGCQATMTLAIVISIPPR